MVPKIQHEELVKYCNTLHEKIDLLMKQHSPLIEAINKFCKTIYYADKKDPIFRAFDEKNNNLEMQEYHKVMIDSRIRSICEKALKEYYEIIYGVK